LRARIIERHATDRNHDSLDLRKCSRDLQVTVAEQKKETLQFAVT
jgi:hypothetical protein